MATESAISPNTQQAAIRWLNDHDKMRVLMSAIRSTTERTPAKGKAAGLRGTPSFAAAKGAPKITASMATKPATASDTGACMLTVAFQPGVAKGWTLFASALRGKAIHTAYALSPPSTKAAIQRSLASGRSTPRSSHAIAVRRCRPPAST